MFVVIHKNPPVVYDRYNYQQRHGGNNMVKCKDTRTLEVVNPKCCGIDVHKESLSACLLYTDGEGREQTEIKEYRTFTDDLYRFRDWLIERKCPIAVMESTGIYWRPVHNVLEGQIDVLIVNARAIKNVPGRKTDIADSRWLAKLLRVGLLKRSFIPTKEVREWRDLLRLRRKYKETICDFRRRAHKFFETVNIKIDSVVSDLFGATGRALMELLLKKGSKITLSDVQRCVHGSLKGKVEELYRSVRGFFSEHHRFHLESLLETIDYFEKEAAKIDNRISMLMKEHEELIKRLKEAPGISDITAQYIISEIGVDLKSFDTAAQLVSWCGLCPGNNESAGKRKSGRNPVRRHYLRVIMVEAAWAAAKKKGSYFRAKYYSLKARLGPKKAIVAVANRLLKGVYHVIKNGVRFEDPGEEYLANINKKAKINRLAKQAASYGFALIPISA
jgi:transposase